jgi:hypothetical protein
VRERGVASPGYHADADAYDREHGHEEHRDWMPNLAHHAARTESKIVLATIPFRDKPISTSVGRKRPGTATITSTTPP